MVEFPLVHIARLSLIFLKMDRAKSPVDFKKEVLGWNLQCYKKFCQIYIMKD